MADGKLYVFSGSGKMTPQSESPVIFDTAYLYDLESDSWAKLETTVPAGLLGGIRSSAIGWQERDLRRLGSQQCAYGEVIVTGRRRLLCERRSRALRFMECPLVE
ncbi:hypothetical protein [Sulfitobacter sp. 915]|uniref:hypothetical protein n=1 Tax=Sulfitobacter sp. 915 TaxID=3368558 RepID=UPI003745B5EC